MRFRSAITGRFVRRLFARRHPETTVSETVTYASPTPFVIQTGVEGTRPTYSGGYPFPKAVSGIGSPFKAQIRCPRCDKLTPVDAACRWCQSELDDGDAA